MNILFTFSPLRLHIPKSPLPSLLRNRGMNCTNLALSNEEKISERFYKSLEVECRGHDKAVLKSYSKFLSTTANHLKMDIVDIKTPRYHIQRYTVLKSVHIYKKHRVQYEIRTHFLIMIFKNLTKSTSDTFLEYVQLNLPEGVSMKVTTDELTGLPEHIKK